jgi:hypothetical protein
MSPVKAGAHVKQKVTEFHDRAGYKGTGRARNPDVSGKPTAVPREAGHYHPIGKHSTKGLMGDIGEVKHHNANTYDFRAIGKHSGPSPKMDQSKRSGAVGNSKGSAPPGVGSGGGRRGSPETHLGKAGRGGTGRITKLDSSRLSESPSHGWFENLGAK